MVVFVATVTVHPDKLEEARQIVEDLVGVCQQQSGIPLFWVGQGQKDPATFVFYEVYRDPEAQKEHQADPEYRRLFLEPWMPLVKSYQFYAEVASILPERLA
jgi:quinol monooxygenase YgiN